MDHWSSKRRKPKRKDEDVTAPMSLPWVIPSKLSELVMDLLGIVVVIAFRTVSDRKPHTDLVILDLPFKVSQSRRKGIW